MHDIMMAHHKSLVSVQFSGVEENSSLMVSGPCLSGNMSSHFYFESCQKTTMSCLRCFTMRNMIGALESDRDGMAHLLTWAKKLSEREVTRGNLIILVSFGKLKCYFQHGNYDMNSQVSVNSDTFVNLN